MSSGSSPSPIRGQTTNACRPAATCSRIRCQARSSQLGCSATGTTALVTVARPAGSSCSSETSRSPNTVIATVRGIGVAVITSMCGGAGALPRSASRCSTPNRCCSSITTSPSSANCTWSWISAWVPITMPAVPDAASSSAARRAAADIEPVSSTTRVPSSEPPRVPAWARSPSRSLMVTACWAASTSVGASSAAWPPASTTCSIARSASTVLPEPTSPCSSRCIGCTCGQLGLDQPGDLGLLAGEAGTAADRRRRPPARRSPGAGPAPGWPPARAGAGPGSAAPRTPRRRPAGAGPAR